MILLGAEISLIKTNKGVSEEKRAELLERFDAVIATYRELWLYRNYPYDMSVSVGNLEARKAELAEY